MSTDSSTTVSSETEERQSDVSSRSSRISGVNLNSNIKDGMNTYYTNAESLLTKREELQTEIDSKSYVSITEVYTKSIAATVISQSELQLNGYEMIHGEVSVTVEVFVFITSHNYQ